MKKFTVLILFTFCFLSCDITKQASKRKTESSISEDWEQKEYRPSASVLYTPPANVVLRDTTIVVANSEGTKIRMQYDKEGKLREAECLPALIDIVTKMSKMVEESTKEKQKDKTEEFSDTWVLYIMGGIALIVIFGMFLIYKTVNKHGKAIEAIYSKLG